VSRRPLHLGRGRSVGRRPLIDPSRQLWEEGARRLDAEASDPIRHRQLWGLVETLVAELRRRLGQRFTLGELVALHSQAAEDWARELLVESLPAEPRVGAPDLALVLDAAFHVYARGAADYVP
jgi:hypothetical protein